jgi:hypothetical protein
MNPLSIALLLLLPAPPALADDKPGPPEGFTPLFDGKGLDGWKMVNTKENFYVKDGVLVMDRGKGWLATEKTFGDFELRLRYRFVTPGADSGVFIRSSLEGKNWTSRGYQVQNMDNETLGMVVGMGLKIKGVKKPEVVKRVKKPAGRWMTLDIVARGKDCTVTLDGETVATSDDLQVADGHIGLQAEGGILEFQRIDIKPLDAAKADGPGQAPETAALERTLKEVQEQAERLRREQQELNAEIRRLKEDMECRENTENDRVKIQLLKPRGSC